MTATSDRPIAKEALDGFVPRPTVPVGAEEDPTASEASLLRAAEQPYALADPVPLGLLALSIPLLALSWINIGMIKPTAMPVVLATILLYGGLGQFVVAMWAVRLGNTFAVAAFGTFACFNISFWYFFTHGLVTIPPAAQPAALALFLGIWAIPAFILFVASFRTTLVVFLIFGLATVLFIVAAVGQYQASDALIKTSGWLGIGIALVAFYGCLSALTSETFGRVLLPNPELRIGQK
jgi:uncharacterized protein